jgi:hypothetical protein
LTKASLIKVQTAADNFVCFFTNLKRETIPYGVIPVANVLKLFFNTTDSATDYEFEISKCGTRSKFLASSKQ